MTANPPLVDPAQSQTPLDRWRLQQLALVSQVATQVTDILDLTELFERVTHLILETFNYYYVALFTLSEDGQRLSFGAGAGPQQAGALSRARQWAASLDVQLGQGIIGWVAQHGQELLANDVTQESRYRYETALPETRAEVALPLMVEDRILGVLDVQSDEPNDFDQTDLLVLRTLAAQVAMAIEDTRLYLAAQRRADQLLAVSEVSRAVASVLDVDQLLQQVADLISERFGHPFAHLFVVQPERGRVVFKAGSGVRVPAMQDLQVSYDLDEEPGLIPWVARTGETALVNDVSRDPRYRPPVAFPLATRSELTIPLIFGDEVLGVLDVQSDQEQAFDADDQLVLETLAASVAVALRNAYLYRSERWRRQTADSLRQVAGALSSLSSLDRLFEAILAELARVLPCEAAAIWLLDEGALRLRTAIPGDIDRAAVRADSAWLATALEASEAIIRQPHHPADPLAEALGLAADHSALATPLRVGAETLGLLTLTHSAPQRYGRESHLLSQAFGSQAAIAIENARLYQAAQEQAWNSTTLLQVSEATRSLSSLEEVLAAVVRITPLLAGVDRCAIWLPAGQSDGFELAAAYGLAPEVQADFEANPLPASLPALERLRRDKAPVRLNDDDAGLAARLQTVSPLLLPLLARGEVLGAMLVELGPSTLPDDDRIRLLNGIAHQAASAIEATRLLEAQQEEAYVSTALLQVAQAVVQQTDLADVLATIVRLTPLLVGVDLCLVVLEAGEPSQFVVAQAFGLKPGEVPPPFDLAAFPSLAIALQSGLAVEMTGPSPQSLPPGLRPHLADSDLLILPLTVKGERLGALVVADRGGGRSLAGKRRDILTGIAFQAALAVDNARLHARRTEQERLGRELQLAHEIQATFIPSKLPSLPGWEMAAFWRSAQAVGGDFYDLIRQPNDQLLIVIADVAGKGMPAALLMALTRSMIRAAALEFTTPADILSRTNALLLPDMPSGMFVSVFGAVLDLQRGLLTYASAGHNPPLLVSPAGKSTSLRPKGMVLGVLEDVYLEQRQHQLEPGAGLVFYTDGVTEIFSADGEMFGQERLVELVARQWAQPAEALVQTISQTALGFSDPKLIADDFTLLLVRYRGREGR